MKKVLTVSLALILALTLFVGCSSGKKLADFAKEQNDVYSTMSTDQYSIECTAEGKSLIFTCTYKIDGITEESAKAGLDSIGSTFSTVVQSAKTAGYDCDKVVVEFKDKDGKILASKEFS